MTERRPLLFSRRMAVAERAGVPMDATFNRIVREVEAEHDITWPFPPYPNPLDRGNRVPKFNPDNFEDAPL